MVLSVEAVFATDWFSETGELPSIRTRRRRSPSPRLSPGRLRSVRTGCSARWFPSGPGFREQNNLKLFNELIYAARRRLCVTSPYFVPDESLLQALTSAALRGVDVELVRVRGGRPGSGAPRAEFLLRRTARGWGEDLAVSGPLRAARQARQRRRRRRRGRVQQHGHPLVPARPGGLAAGVRARVRRPGPRRGGPQPGSQPAAHPVAVGRPGPGTRSCWTIWPGSRRRCSEPTEPRDTARAGEARA